MDNRAWKSAASATPPSAPASPSMGYPSEGDPLTATPATKGGAFWFHQIGEELRAVLTAAGITPSTANNAQLLEAIQLLIDAQSGNYALDTGAANAYVVELSPAITAYTDGMTVRVKAVNANTAASTLNAGAGAVALVNDAGGALVDGDVPAASIFTATYIASVNKFYITSLVQSQGDARYARKGANSDITSLSALASINGGQIGGFRNRIINGDMKIAQRAAVNTNVALTALYAYASVDRFAVYQNGTANGWSAQLNTSPPTGFLNCLRIGRATGAVTTGNIALVQALETVNSIPLQGLPVTFSFYAKAGANFSAAGNNISATVYTGTGTDQGVSSASGGWTGASSALNITQAITAGWVRYQFTGTVAANATQVAVNINYTPTGTAGADDYLYVTGLQLEVGSVATPFESRPIGVELSLCQRYFELWHIGYFNAYAAGVNNFGQTNAFHVTKRVAPTIAILTAPTYTNAGSLTTYGTTVDDTGWYIVSAGAGNALAYGAVLSASSEL